MRLTNKGVLSWTNESIQNDQCVSLVHNSIFNHDLAANHVTPLQSYWNAFLSPRKEKHKLCVEYFMQHIQDKEIQDVSELTYSDFACMKAVCHFVCNSNNSREGCTNSSGRTNQNIESMYTSSSQNYMFGYATRCMDLLLCKRYFS